jgi:hypothetical protein
VVGRGVLGAVGILAIQVGILTLAVAGGIGRGGYLHRFAGIGRRHGGRRRGDRDNTRAH